MSKRNRCLKGHQHLWITVHEFVTHLIKRCERCHTSRWVARHNH